MSKTVCVVFHSGYGHTEVQAKAVAEGIDNVEGVESQLISVDLLVDADAPAWDILDNADGIIFGSPTYMGSASADMKRFMDASSSRWFTQKWADKISGGFTNSGSRNGDKQNTLMQFFTLAAQHGMVWISLNLMPGNNSSAGSEDDLNRLGSSIGAMAQSNVDEGPDKGPSASDIATAKSYGARIANCVVRWN